MEIQLTGVLVVAAGAFAVPLGLGCWTSLRLPSVVLEIVVGILIEPVVLRLVEIGAPLRILSLFMLAIHSRGGRARRHVPPKGLIDPADSATPSRPPPPPTG
jgi:hypothetical protein